MKKILLIIFLLYSAIINAQTLKVSADKNPAIVGEQILLQYSIDQKAKNFKSPNFNGLQILSGPNPSTQSSYTFVNGKSQSNISTTYSFYLKAIKKPRPWAGFWLGSPMLMRLRQPFRFWLESVDPSGDFHFQQPSRKT